MVSFPIKNPTEKEIEILQLIQDSGQSHIFDQWEIGQNESEKRSLISQVTHLDKQCVGGFKEYFETCRRLLSQGDTNPLEGWKPSVPRRFSFDFASKDFREAENIGLQQLPKTAFVLVAGGLGERLGYSGIKLELTSELTTEKCFFGLYVQFLEEYQRKAREICGDQNLEIPLAIMTSDDTHNKTLQMLKKHKNFGLSESQITLMKQEKVPSILDHQAKVAMISPFEIATKPHGHGDVHSLLLRYVLPQWNEKGIRHIIFFQDTNLLVFRGILCLLGNSVLNRLDVNFLVIPRRTGEAVGSFCRLSNNDSTPVNKTVNVEYNQFENLLKANGITDTKDNRGFSEFPGNANVFVLRFKPYFERIESSQGRMPDYINPKYKDKAKGLFKSPARLECAMPDYSTMLKSDDMVGCTQLEREICFSAAKNSIEDAVVKLEKTGYSESVASAEASLYAFNRRLLRVIGCDLNQSGPSCSFKGLKIDHGAHVVLEPSFGVTVDEVESRFTRPKDVTVTDRSTLVLGGHGLKIKRLKLDGTLILKAEKSSLITDLDVKNEGWEFIPLDCNEKEDLIVRGYKLSKRDQVVKTMDEVSER